MWLITFEASPNPKTNTEQFSEFAGAYVNCWVDFVQEDGALKLAKFYIKDSGWIPKNKCQDISWYQKKTDLEDEHSKLCFIEARKYGFQLCFHTFPIEETELEENSVSNKDESRLKSC